MRSVLAQEREIYSGMMSRFGDQQKAIDLDTLNDEEPARDSR